MILINVFYVVSGIIHLPLQHVDSYSIWLFKAKAFHIENGLPLYTLKNPEFLYFHPQYPVLLPFSFSVIYRLVGGIKEIYVLALYPMFYVAILFLAYKTLRALKTNKTISLLSVYIYSMFSPLMAQAGRGHAGLSDIVITLLYWTFLLVLISSTHKRGGGHFWIIVIIMMIASQIKQEALLLSAFLLFLPISRRKKLIGFLFGLLPTLLWFLTVKEYNIPSSFRFLSLSFSSFIERVILVPLFLLKEMINVKNWYIFWPLFFLLLIIQKEKKYIFKSKINPVFLLIFFTYFVSYIFITMESTDQVSGLVSSTSERLFLQLSPFYFTIFISRLNSFFRNFSKTF